MNISEYVEKEIDFKGGECTLNCAFLGNLYKTPPEKARFCNLFLDAIYEMKRVRKCKKMMSS